MKICHVVEHLISRSELEAKLFGANDDSALLALEMAESVTKLHEAALATLRDNAGLADGDNCTLILLKRALE